jgi:uncharacterized spore protein YtfJ
MATPTADVPRHHADDILGSLAEKVGARFSATNVFGAPVERDGVTVIPVATMRFALGGGGGGDAASEQEGEGGGAFGAGGPAGYIELKDGASRFVPVVHPARMAALVCAAVLGGMLIVRVGRHRPRRARWPFARAAGMTGR